MDNKIQLKFSGKIENIELGRETIKVDTLISIQNMSLLKEVYISSLFKDGKENSWDEQFAEFMFRRHILILQTNIDVENMKELKDVELLLWGDFYNNIVSKVINYKEMVSSLKESVEHEVEKYKIENSAGKVLSGLIEYVSSFIEEFKNMKPEDFEKMKSEAGKIMEQMKESPVSSILSEATKQKKTTRKKKEHVQ